MLLNHTWGYLLKITFKKTKKKPLPVVLLANTVIKEMARELLMGLWDRKHNCFIFGSCNILRRPEYTAFRNCHLKNERLFPFDYNFL